MHIFQPLQRHDAEQEQAGWAVTEDEFVPQRPCWNGWAGRDPRCRCLCASDRSSASDTVPLCLPVTSAGSATEILEAPTEGCCSASGRFPEFIFVLRGAENLKFQNNSKGKLWGKNRNNHRLLGFNSIQLILFFQCSHFAVYCMKMFLQKMYIWLFSVTDYQNERLFYGEKCKLLYSQKGGIACLHNFAACFYESTRF